MHADTPLLRLLYTLALLAAGCLAGCGQEAHDDHDPGEPTAQEEHAGEHAEDDPAHEEDAGEHAEDDPAHEEDADPHEGHDDEVRVELSPDQRERIGLTLAVAGPGSVSVFGTYPGEIVLDPDRVVHVVPRVAGIVREVHKSLGDRVEAGEILAWIESDELAEAKLAYYAKQSEICGCMLRMPRAKEIFENVNRLLVLLEKEPDLEALKELEDLEMGQYRGQLLTAYADLAATRSAYEQEESLRGKKISSERERVQAKAAFEKAQAAFIAAKDTARYQVRLEYSDEAQKLQIAEVEAAVVEKLRALVPRTEELEPCLCDDPDCKHGEIPSVLPELAKDEKFAWTPLRAPLSGFVIEKHLSLGEKADGEESVFAIADTSTVWVRFNVYQKDLASVRTGLTVRVTPGAGSASRDGVVSYVPPTLDEATRTAPARIVLENPDGSLRPGLYATVRVDVGAVRGAVVIPRAAVQIVDQKEVVFVEDGDGFVAEPVTLGPSDRKGVIVTSGLSAGQRFVLEGAFELKAKLATSGLGAHAGHGH